MAINFPSAPTEGQTYSYGGRIWVADANGKWMVQTQVTPAFYASATSPTNFKVGDEWYDTSTGIFYRRIDDGDSEQWVEVGPAALSFAASDTVAGGIEIATQAEMEAAASAVLAVTPGRLQYHPGVAKAWVNFNGTGTPAARSGHNVSSITDNGLGLWTANFTTAFSNANYAVAISAGYTSGGGTDFGYSVRDHSVPRTTAAISLAYLTSNGGAFADTANFDVTAFGDQ
jgi:hypothetical protein